MATPQFVHVIAVRASENDGWMVINRYDNMKFSIGEARLRARTLARYWKHVRLFLMAEVLDDGDLKLQNETEYFGKGDFDAGL